MSQPNLTIGALSAHTGCNVPTIRYYEQIGLLPPPQRASNGRRYYRDADLTRLTFIKRCRDFGFPIEQVRELASLFEDGERPCVEVRDMAQEHLDTVRAKLDALRQLEATLEAFVDRCTAACIGGTTRHCVIIDDLSSAEDKSDNRSSASCCGGAASAIPPKRVVTATELKRG